MQNTIFQQWANLITDTLPSKMLRDNQSVRGDIRATKAKLFGVIEHFSEIKSSVNSMSSTDSSQLQVVVLTKLADI